MGKPSLQKVAVTGARGLLGSECVELCSKRGWEVVALSRNELDLEAFEDFPGILTGISPDAVIHCAAETNVDLCEREPAWANRINAEATGALARAAHQVGAKVVYIGSCGIFDGKKRTPYLESDLPQPLTQYASSKFRGEAECLTVDAGNLVCRVGWLFGGDTGQRKNFVEARRKEAATGKEMVSANDKWGSPTWARDAADRIVRLLEVDASGVCHVANSGIASRQDYVTAIVQTFEPGRLVKGVDSSHFPRSAPVPDFEALASERFDEWGIGAMPDWKDALRRYVTMAYRSLGD